MWYTSTNFASQILALFGKGKGSGIYRQLFVFSTLKSRDKTGDRNPNSIFIYVVC